MADEGLYAFPAVPKSEPPKDTLIAPVVAPASGLMLDGAGAL
jgi:hypothetical protein